MLIVNNIPKGSRIIEQVNYHAKGFVQFNGFLNESWLNYSLNCGTASTVAIWKLKSLKK